MVCNHTLSMPDLIVLNRPSHREVIGCSILQSAGICSKLAPAVAIYHTVCQRQLQCSAAR
uniref:Uncharacterized protein n=1 Tax=Anguilla anguilla TaxID=7936 RepID=A0A0E9QWI7_ANGAN